MKTVLRIKIRKDVIKLRCKFHKPTRAFKHPKAYARKEKFQKPLDN